MANWSILKNAIASVIKTNGNQEITGQILQNTLNSIVNAVGENATFAGVATPSTNPGTPDGPVFYIASEPGTYANFGGISVADGEAVILQWDNGAWTKKTTGLATEQDIIYDVSARNGGVVFESLSALLSSSNLSTLIPTSVRHGGMSIRFIQGSVPNSDTKYMQYRFLLSSFNASQFADTDNWIDEGLVNVVKSLLGDIPEITNTTIGYIKNDGTVVSSGDFTTNTYNVIPNTAYKIFGQNGSGGTSVCCALYDNNGDCTRVFGTGKSVTYDGIVTTLSNEVVMKVCIVGSINRPKCNILGFSLGEIKGNYILSNNPINFKSISNISLNKYFIKGYFSNNYKREFDFTIQYNSSFECLIFNAKGNTTVKLNNINGGTNGRAWAIYDKLGNLKSCASDNITISEETTLNIQEDGFVVINNKISSSSTPSVIISSLSVNDSFAGLYIYCITNKIALNEKQITSIENLVNDNKNKIDVTLNTLKNFTGSEVQYTSETNAYIRKDNGNLEAAANFLTRTYNISPQTMYKIWGQNGSGENSVCAALYDSNGSRTRSLGTNKSTIYDDVIITESNEVIIKICCYLGSSPVHYQECNNIDNKSNEELNILLIGNSFSLDSEAYLIEENCILDSIKTLHDKNINIYHAIYGGRGLEGWWNILENNMVSYSKVYGSGMTNGKFDHVVIQQVSSECATYSSYFPYLGNNYERLKEYLGESSKVWLLMPWSRGIGTDGGSGIPYVEEGYERIADTIKRITSDYPQLSLGIIPQGTAIQNARGNSLLDNGYGLTRDGQHLSTGTGRYIAASLLYHLLIEPFTNVKLVSITKNYEEESDDWNVSEKIYDGVDVTDSNRLLCQRCALYASTNIYSISNIV